MERKRQFMDREVFSTILHKYIVPYQHVNTPKDGRPTFIGHKDGETLLNKQYPEMLKEVSNAVGSGMNIDVYTHGLLLPKWRERGHDFIDFLGSLPNRCRLLVSFHFNNIEGTVNDYTETTAYLKDAIQTRPPNVEIILVSHLVSPMTKETLNDWRETWRPEIDRGIAVHANASINPWTGRIEDPNCSHFNGCPYGDFGHWFFGVTGNLIACCMDLEEEITFGNVMFDDPAEMFEKVKAFYAAQTRREVQFDVCANCFGLEPFPKLVQLGGVA